MKKITSGLLLVVVLSLVTVTTAFADAPEKTPGFVCPVLGGQAGEAHGNSPQKFVQIGDGDYTVLGPNVSVPVHATNDDGNGTPPGPHASPGDPGYTAIWATPE